MVFELDLVVGGGLLVYLGHEHDENGALGDFGSPSQTIYKAKWHFKLAVMSH